YQILFNDAVAMTGGQPLEGALTPARIQRQVRAEGVERIVVATDEPQKYPSGYFESGVQVVHRSELDAVQRSLREEDGVTVLIYDQTCAAEKRRRRKRGTFPDPDRRVFINEAVCEGCGDCGEKSNCVAIEPVQTEFGRKRRINQSSCNKDFSCVDGFCPSFVTVQGARLRRPSAKATAPGAVQTALPAARAPVLESPYSVLVTGIGGTGVVTIGQILGMAAYLEGKGATVLDMAGLAQKNGAVISFVRIARSQAALHAPRVSVASADAVIGCDLVVTAGRETLARVAPGRTRIVADLARTPTAEFTRDPDWAFPLDRMKSAIETAAGDEMASFVDATRLATALMGDAIAANMFMLGYAYQQGLVPVSAGAIERAIELNAVAVEMNQRAFAWGRRAAVDPGAVEAAAGPPRELVPVSRLLSASLDEAIARRVDFLADYQNDRWARRFSALVERVREAEATLLGAQGRDDADDTGEAGEAGTQRSGAQRPFALTEAVARNLFKLMSYKDEYEVARLFTNGEFEARLAEQFEPGFSLRFHLAPPLWARRNARGELLKRSYGPWMLGAFRWLARLRWLRATPLDPFGHSVERRGERRLIDEYETTLGRLLESLHPGNHALAVEIASLPQRIRGFGHVKARNLAAIEQSRTQLLRAFDEASVSRLAVV
ncbi:MAG: indolepyruvate ferredoxin oxidoreductase family protein, partial [Burkholderiaceae bacterium]|nr:indolepyruvate ferredoxin oxidoreductase family protein [Burkholderiaceae bacterium]